MGIISEIGDQTYERVHTAGTRHVVEAARAAGVSRYVHMSALGTRPQARARYHQSKWEAEQWVRASPLDWTILAIATPPTNTNRTTTHKTDL